MCRNMKGGWAAAEATAFASEGGHKLSTRYKGAAKENPSEYILLSAGGKVGADKNGGDGGRADGGRGCGELRDSNARARICLLYIYNLNKNKTDTNSKFTAYHTIICFCWFLRY